MDSQLNRRQRRALAKKSKKIGLQQAAEQVGSAVEAFKKIEGLEDTARMLEGLEQSITENLEMVKVLAQDIQRLDTELEIQREVNLRLLSSLYANDNFPEAQALEQLKELEHRVQEALLAEIDEQPEEP